MGNPTGGRESIALSSSEAAGDLLTKLPDELAVEILSRLGTLNEAVRCSSLLCKRWKNIWRLIDGGVLTFGKFCELQPMRSRFRRLLLRIRRLLWSDIAEEIKSGRCTNRVNQMLTSHSLVIHQKLDSLIIGFNLRLEEREILKLIEFGLTKGIKELILSKNCSSPYRSRVSLSSYLTSEVLSKHDISRLEVLDLEGVSEISQATVDHIFSNCVSLRRLKLYFESRSKKLVIRVCSSNNNLLNLDIKVGRYCHTRVELISAPGLHTFKFSGDNYEDQVKLEGDLPQLREGWFGGRGLCTTPDYLPWSRSQFNKFASRLEHLGLELGWIHFLPRFVIPPEWMVFEKLRVLDLIIRTETTPRSYLESTVLLGAAPMLQELSIRFPDADWSGRWERRDLRAESTWKHLHLKVLQLHGVNPIALLEFDVRKPQLELAAYIIMNAPCLNHVLIDTRRPKWTRYPAFDPRDPHEADVDIYQAKKELEAQLQAYSISPKVNFTYR